MTTLLYISISLNVIVLIVLAILLVKIFSIKSNDSQSDLTKIKLEMQQQLSTLRQEINSGLSSQIKNLSEILSNNISGSYQSQEMRFKTFAFENEQRLDAIRVSVEKKLSYIQDDNNKQLDNIRKIVDEKMQQTLEDKMTKSFQVVTQSLQEVYKGLGEMQTLAVGVGDLKKVLSNVKTRGILGEIQLGAILEEILAPEQYETNVITKKGSQSFVEFAIKIPADDDTSIYLPIDSKFPCDAYNQLIDAYDSGSPEAVTAAATALKNRMKSFAKDIRDKYIDYPNTTEFAIMFLPFEGLYAEAVNRGLVEILQREFKVNIAGPSTMAALLNSLQMGFKTFAIQKRSSEVWSVLGAVKTEFDKFTTALTLTQQRLEQANSELDKLVGVRTRQMQKRLKSVTSLSDISAGKILDAAFDDSEE
ncbi:MAG: DNA recombination protein RmuC [Oscillospiraceae bacterium]